MLKIEEAFTRVWPQWVAAFVVTLLTMNFGLVVGWTSPYLVILTSQDSPFPVTASQASWIASLLPFGRLIGSICGAVTMEYFGSRTALLMAGVPIMIGWFLVIVANSVEWLYAFRIFAGISIGMHLSCFSIYIGEIAAAHIRGALVSTIVNGVPMGLLIGSIMGTLIPMLWFGVISLILILCYLAIFPCLPQSPYYNAIHNNVEEAKRTIQWYHRKSNVDEELEIIERFVYASVSHNFHARLMQITEKKNRRVFIMIVLLFIFLQLSGLNSITFYKQIIVTKAKVTCIKPSLVVIICGALGIVVGWIGVVLIDRCGRRFLLLLSCSFAIVATGLLTLHFILLEQDLNPKNLEWMTILSMLAYTMLFIGMVPVPSTMLGELFPADLKSIAGFVGSIVGAFFAFLTSRSYQPLVELITEKYVFLIYMLAMIICLIYSLYDVPETKGKTLQALGIVLIFRNTNKSLRSTSFLEALLMQRLQEIQDMLIKQSMHVLPRTGIPRESRV